MPYHVINKKMIPPSPFFSYCCASKDATYFIHYLNRNCYWTYISQLVWHIICYTSQSMCEC